MRFASLGSGSEGNSLVVELPEDEGFLLVDCGFALKEVARRLARLQLELSGLRAILVTHEHSDHVGGVFKLAVAAAVPVYLTYGTREGSRRLPTFDEQVCRLIWPDQPIEIHGLGVTPFAVPHDAREPVQYIFEDTASRLGLLTDIGRSTPHVIGALAGVSALVLEANHDRSMLADGHYPPALKRRIGGDYGHLENQAAAAILASLDRCRLHTVVAAHLSRHNNRAELARLALAAVMNCAPEVIPVADQDLGSAWLRA
ncbi:MAG: MBL fold metallo-hydrolase [Lautropia sp.]|nr:MBL fold metallo-hydrolase [Lautropia sp.]